ncbi:MAG: DNA recombination protein RmuC [Candidatus Marinimicrobia bacterium]|jgi:DNA recombination protein RmuC|nr:DNA recombination protein RmuC [Candidatus Neomarinimicrobiota bacterium]MBT3574555.1 DNA recombination protein RmuC [Candidatus Neomarinimicrobiota bacterium]MBT3680477.1 DNA recombination protein RmuC [Candidatus Neomarinimicrobiota bacterium]MBT3951213.1 DNA recombination protein RmuC [Candidatus Neomarinimicrobiota bacterium]MBT4253018.1 DNA recombination protein RmuC [Candidatus Neomarinimicrobiota bacterium]
MEIVYTLLIAALTAAVTFVIARMTQGSGDSKDRETITRLEVERRNLQDQLERAENELEKVRSEALELREQNATINTRLEESKDRLVEEKKRLLEMKEQLQDSFKSLSQDVLRDSQKEFLRLADEKFKDQSKQNQSHLGEKEKLIQKSLENMDGRLKDIVQRSTELKTELETSKDETQRLRTTTETLQTLLASSQKRGQWGERLVEDILNYVGLQENINYTKQSTMDDGQRPDYTFKLPKSREINMDVKFPLAHYENYLQTTDVQLQDIEKKAFLQDVRKHLNEISKRGYIDTAKGTVDYAMMFIPNESIYGFINQEDPDFIGEALSKKIMLCSPITLYAVLSLLNQATSNFMMEQRASEIMNEVVKFQQQWDKFSEVMNKTEKNLDIAVRQFQELISTRSRALERPVNKILELQKKEALLPGATQLDLDSGDGD